MKDGVQNESWTQNEHHPRVVSEMTRYTGQLKNCFVVKCLLVFITYMYSKTYESVNNRSGLGSISAVLSCLVCVPSPGEERGLLSRTAAGDQA